MPRDKKTRTAVHLGLVAAAVLTHRLTTHPITCTARPSPSDTLVVLSWNLENFPGDHHLAKMAARIAEADPHVLAVQEVLDPDALTRLVPDRIVNLSERGGARNQKLGFATLPDAEASPLVEHAAFEHGGRVRPAVSSFVRVGTVDFHLVVVHLKATPDGLDTRHVQWAALADLVGRLRLVGPGAGDDDLIVVGDFNTTGAGDVTPADERAALGAVLAAVGLRAVLPSGGCSAYWDGQRHDAWLEPTLLDLAFVGGFPGTEIRARTLGACAVHDCAPLRSTDAHPDPDILGMSDHCPLLLEIDASP